MDLEFLRDCRTAIQAVFAAVAISALILYSRKSSRLSNPLPPGPPADLIIGHLRIMPKNAPMETFSEWARQYGDVIQIKLPGTCIIVISNVDTMHELLSKRVNTTSDRKIGFMLRELMGFGWVLPFMKPNHAHQLQRKMLRRALGPQKVAAHDVLFDATSKRMLLELEGFRGDPKSVIKQILGRMIIEIAYGREVWKDIGPELMKVNVEAMDLIDQAFFGVWLVDFLPIARFLPRWFPGTGSFWNIADRAKYLAGRMQNEPYQRVMQLSEKGMLDHSLAKDLLDESELSEDARDALATLYLAGSDTTTVAVVSFLYAAFQFPRVAEKMRREIQQVTDGDGAPRISDRSHLPYTEAVWKEALRWNPPFNSNVPHVTTEDEILKGMLIPQGSMILANYGFILTDPNIWGDPQNFRPERFLEPGAEGLLDPSNLVFGAGGRICSGMYLADRIGFHLAATAAAVFQLLPLEGKELPDSTTVKFEGLAFHYPPDFNCRFVAWDDKAESILKNLRINGIDD